jgi:hypothetical protein
MTKPSWRDEWAPFRVAFVDETAVCPINQLSADTAGKTRPWNELTSEEQDKIVGNTARYFLAQDEAIHNLAQRKIPF